MTMGKIVLVPFPFDDLTTLKVRPAVCLTEPLGKHRHIVLAFIGSRIPDELLITDLLFDSKHDDFVITGLRVTSVLRLHRLITISTNLIRRELGELPPKMTTELKEKMRLLFALDKDEQKLNYTYNKKTDLLYIRFADKKQEVLNKRISDNIHLDIGENERIIGIEILDASKHINLEKLKPSK